jgi:hypothetical protein
LQITLQPRAKPNALLRLPFVFLFGVGANFDTRETGYGEGLFFAKSNLNREDDSGFFLASAG